MSNKESPTRKPTGSPAPLPIPPSSPVLTHVERISNKQSDERERFFLLYENEGILPGGSSPEPGSPQQARLAEIDVNCIDHYGFIHDQAVPSMSVLERKQLQQELKRSQRWNKMLPKWNSILTKDAEQLRRRIFKGLPATLRGAFWSRLFDLEEQLRVNKGYYDLLKTKARQSSTYLSQIDLDVHRTYRNHQMFCDRYCVRQKHLFSILAAYSVYNTEVGYTQGMNQIVAFLLFYLTEEEAFWALCQLMTGPRWTMHGFFCPGFPKLFRFQAQFEKILKKMLPKIYKHFLTYQVQCDLYTIRWFMLCYLDCLPFPLTLRLWDIFILDGDQLILIVAFCILRIHRKKLLHLKTFESINAFLKSELCVNFGNSSLTFDEIIEELNVCHEKLKQNNLLTLPPPTEQELPTKPFNISMNDIAKLTTTMRKKEEKSKSPPPPSSRILTSTMSPKDVHVPVVETFLPALITAPLAVVDDDQTVHLRDTSIEDRYIEFKRLTRTQPLLDPNVHLTEYDSLTLLSSADPSVIGQRLRHDDEETISSKSDYIDNDEHVQISHMITTSFMTEDLDQQRRMLKRSPSFYDNVDDEQQLDVYNRHFPNSFLHSQIYAFETDIR